jgi:transposase
VKSKHVVCSNCGGHHVERRGIRQRKLILPPTGDKQRILVVSIPRVCCHDCKILRQIKLEIAEPKKSYTKSFAKYVIVKLHHNMAMNQIAALLKVGWDIIKDIIKTYLQKKYSHVDMSNLRRIAIDEISSKRGHKYLTLVLNLDTGNVIFVGYGKAARALEPFWKLLGKRRMSKIEAVAMDLGKAYQKAVKVNIPNAPIVFDHFHVVLNINKMLDELRRYVYRTAKSEQKSVIQGTRWILMYNNENLLEHKNQRQLLEEALEVNRALSIGYYLKEEIRQIWRTYSTKEKAKEVLMDWVCKALNEEVKPLQRMGYFIWEHMEGILNWYDHKISSGPIEGLNNKIKVLKRIAYGFRDEVFFSLRIMDIHRAKTIATQ